MFSFSLINSVQASIKKHSKESLIALALLGPGRACPPGSPAATFPRRRHKPRRPPALRYQTPDPCAGQGSPPRVRSRWRRTSSLAPADIPSGHRYTHGSANCDGGNRHAFDECKRIALHQHPVGKGAGIAFIGVADDIFLFSRGGAYRFPFDTRGKARAATPAQARGFYLGKNSRRPQRERTR